MLLPAWVNYGILKLVHGHYSVSASVLIIRFCFYLEHRCDFPGCKNVIVLDGNMKNRRDICLAKDAGSIQYPGLPATIKTGCMASPAFKSRFCHQHKVRSCLTEGGTYTTLTIFHS